MIPGLPLDPPTPQRCGPGGRELCAELANRSLCACLPLGGIQPTDRKGVGSVLRLEGGAQVPPLGQCLWL